MVDIRHSLATFLRSRRDRLTPADMGIISSGRRRAPGLRREEVAQLAGVGLTWYTWLEQGRDVHPSESVTRAIGRTLGLDCDEMSYLLTLTGHPHRFDLLARAEILPGHLAILDQMLPHPVCIHDARFDLYAYNRTYRFLLTDLNQIAAGDRNYMVQFFTNPEWHRRFCDFDETARSLVGRIRSRIAHQPGDPAWTELVDRLQRESADFARIWAEHEVSAPAQLQKVIDNPLVGWLTLDLTRMPLGERSGGRIGILTPKDDQTTNRLYQLDRNVCDEPVRWVRDDDPRPALTQLVDHRIDHRGDQRDHVDPDQGVPSKINNVSALP